MPREIVAITLEKDALPLGAGVESRQGSAAVWYGKRNDYSPDANTFTQTEQGVEVTTERWEYGAPRYTMTLYPWHVIKAVHWANQ